MSDAQFGTRKKFVKTILALLAVAILFVWFLNRCYQVAEANRMVETNMGTLSRTAFKSFEIEGVGASEENGLKRTLQYSGATATVLGVAHLRDRHNRTGEVEEYWQVVAITPRGTFMVADYMIDRFAGPEVLGTDRIHAFRGGPTYVETAKRALRQIWRDQPEKYKELFGVDPAPDEENG